MSRTETLPTLNGHAIPTLPKNVVRYVVQIGKSFGDTTVLLTSETMFGPRQVATIARQMAAFADDGEAHILGNRGQAVAWVYADGRAPALFDHADTELNRALTP